MTTAPKSLAETTHRAITALVRELGVVETVRFLNQFGAGAGNYTRERQEMFSDLTMEELLSAVRRRRTRRFAGSDAPARKARRSPRRD